MKERIIATKQDVRDLVLDTLAQFSREHDVRGLTNHIYDTASFSGGELTSVLLNQGDTDLVSVDDFWRLARRYHHETVSLGRSVAGPMYTPERPAPDPEHNGSPLPVRPV